MRLSFSCPRCEQSSETEAPTDGSPVVCVHCQLELAPPPDAWRDGVLTRCLVCPSTDLFVRKDFPQRLGVTIVALGFAASCVTWYFYWTTATFAVLFATALADLALYLIVSDSLACYRCGAQYRQLPTLEHHEKFDLETHERYRQQAARVTHLLGRDNRDR